LIYALFGFGFGGLQSSPSFRMPNTKHTNEGSSNNKGNTGGTPDEQPKPFETFFCVLWIQNNEKFRVSGV